MTFPDFISAAEREPAFDEQVREASAEIRESFADLRPLTELEAMRQRVARMLDRRVRTGAPC